MRIPIFLVTECYKKLQERSLLMYGGSACYICYSCYSVFPPKILRGLFFSEISSLCHIRDTAFGANEGRWLFRKNKSGARVLFGPLLDGAVFNRPQKKDCRDERNPAPAAHEMMIEKKSEFVCGAPPLRKVRCSRPAPPFRG